MLEKITLVGKPQSTSHIYKRGKGRRLYMSDEAQALKEDYAWQAKAQWKGRPITTPLIVVIDLYFPDKRRRDWDNWHKLSMDALTGIVYEDDSQINQACVTKHIDAKNPRIEIRVPQGVDNIGL